MDQCQAAVALVRSTGKALTGPTLYLFLAAGVGFLASRPIALFAMPVLKLEP